MQQIAIREPARDLLGLAGQPRRKKKGPSSHGINRRRADQKRSEENLALFKRLQGVKSEFSRDKMKKDARKQKKLAKSISSFKPTRNKQPLPEWQ
eukprot:g4582.t1